MAVKIFSPIDIENDYHQMSALISEGAFTNKSGEITSFFTSSEQTSSNSGMYYYDIYQESSASATAEVQFSIAYGHISGSGSVVTDDSKPSRSIHNSYSTMILDSGDKNFTINGVDIHHELIINFKRSKFKETIDPGNWQLTLTSGSNTIKLIDDSGESLGTSNPASLTFGGKKYYSVVSGTIAAGPTGSSVSSYVYYGLVYPQLGVIVLNPNTINTHLSMSAESSSFITQSTNSHANNNQRFYNLIKSGASFKARNEETIHSRHYFIRVKSKEYNFSNNPTYISGSVGKIIDNVSKRGIPFSYITGIGLFNDNNELLAVSKLSQPLFKEPGTEALLKIRLDF